MGRREGVLGIYTGASRQGKTYQLKKRVKKSPRVLVWSVKEPVDKYAQTWAGAIVVRGGLHDLRRVLFEQIGSGRGRVVYIPRRLSDFGPWAKLAHAWGIVAPCDVVAEELADVTTPAKAPDGWGNLIRQGLGWGINLYAVTQRPAESDKTAFGNATFLHAHAMSRANDRKTMALEMDIPVADLANLKKYHWIERWLTTQQLKKGR